MTERCCICGDPVTESNAPIAWCLECRRSWQINEVRKELLEKVAEWGADRARRAERARQKARKQRV